MNVSAILYQRVFLVDGGPNLSAEQLSRALTDAGESADVAPRLEDHKLVVIFTGEKRTSAALREAIKRAARSLEQQNGE